MMKILVLVMNYWNDYLLEIDAIDLIFIGLFDLLGQAQSTVADAYWSSPAQAPTAYLAVGIMFFIFCFGMSRYSMFMETKLSRGHK